MDVRIGLGRCHLLLGEPEVALAYARAVVATKPNDDAGWALVIRSLMRARRFREAVDTSIDALRHARAPAIETLAAHGSALFRVQDNERAAQIYRRVLEHDPLHAEAHLRLGSGLTAPRHAEISPAIELGVREFRQGRIDAALAAYVSALEADPGNPVAHRLIGEARLKQRADASMAARADEFRWLRSVLPQPRLHDAPVDEFMPSFADLSDAHQQVARRGLALFWTRLSRLVAIGGRHDLISATERTTDEASRRSLRGRRTFDGRVWDDVRGIGGLRAATGIESLEEARGCGFDTLAHEIAHQAHLYGFPHRERIRIRALYKQALAANRCLDFYAASNDAEYFGQGVEAFSALTKRPGYEVTHSHTRFELMRVDPALHSLIQGLVDFDPLGAGTRTAAQRVEILRAAIATALRAGRTADAETAAGLLPPGQQRDALLQSTQRRHLLAQSY